MALTGDQGARSVLRAHRERVVEVPIDDPAILLDLDTPDALALARQHADLMPGS
jgi:molybdenum cofactor cytidylyltransferase